MTWAPYNFIIRLNSPLNYESIFDDIHKKPFLTSDPCIHFAEKNRTLQNNWKSIKITFLLIHSQLRHFLGSSWIRSSVGPIFLNSSEIFGGTWYVLCPRNHKLCLYSYENESKWWKKGSNHHHILRMVTFCLPVAEISIGECLTTL